MCKISDRIDLESAVYQLVCFCINLYASVSKCILLYLNVCLGSIMSLHSKSKKPGHQG